MDNNKKLILVTIILIIKFIVIFFLHNEVKFYQKNIFGHKYVLPTWIFFHMLHVG